jgi:hypothetical protein
MSSVIGVVQIRALSDDELHQFVAIKPSSVIGVVQIRALFDD